VNRRVTGMEGARHLTHCMIPFDMLTVLHAAERELPHLLLDEAGWNSLKIDYHAPFVDRVWRNWGEYRVSLHRIHPCAPEDALFHPHPWPSAMRVHSGTYEMAVGHGAGDARPPLAVRLVASGAMEYEMTDPDAWHYVRPIGGVAITVMVTGRPWTRSAPRSDAPLQPLPAEDVADLLQHYRTLYPVTG
jgi:hypothetical protein